MTQKSPYKIILYYLYKRKIVGRFSNAGSVLFFHSATVKVLMYCVGKVKSQAIHNLVPD